MQHLRIRFVVRYAALVLAAACTACAPQVEESEPEPDIEFVCASWCDSLRRCDDDVLAQTEQTGSCESFCEVDEAWDDLACGWLLADVVACTSALTCGEYDRLGNEADFEDEPCWLLRATHARECAPHPSRWTLLSRKNARWW